MGGCCAPEARAQRARKRKRSPGSGGAAAGDEGREEGGGGVQAAGVCEPEEPPDARSWKNSRKAAVRLPRAKARLCACVCLRTCCAQSSFWLCRGRKPPLEKQRWPEGGDSEARRRLTGEKASASSCLCCSRKKARPLPVGVQQKHFHASWCVRARLYRARVLRSLTLSCSLTSPCRLETHTHTHTQTHTLRDILPADRRSNEVRSHASR